tara:strand:+ start:2476 stop:3867 length:1392 start_codon:yes stop_codon:yes gene_type:complete
MAKAHKFTPTGLVGHWKFGHGTGTNRRGIIVDESGQGNNGTIYGVPAVSFDGANDFAAISSDPDIFGGSRIAVVVCNFYGIENSANRFLYSEQFTSGSKSRVNVAFLNDNTIELAARSATGDNRGVANAADTVSQSAWHSLVAAIDIEDERAYCWIDGDEPAGWAGGVALNNPQSLDTFDTAAMQAQVWGAANAAAALPFKGKLKWMGLKATSTLPTDADAQAYYNNPQAFLDNYGFDAYWYCDETDLANPDPQDQSGNAHHLALTGATWDVTTNGGNQVMQSGGAGDSFTAGKRWFDGTDDYVSVANAAELVFDTDDFQIHLWLAISSGVANPGGIMYKGDSTDGGWRIYLTADKIAFDGDSVIGTALWLWTHPATYADDALHLLSILRNGSDASMLIDGVEVDTDATANSDFDDASALLIGKDAATFYTGDIYQLLIGKTTKTIAQGTADAVAIFNQGAFV